MSSDRRAFLPIAFAPVGSQKAFSFDKDVTTMKVVIKGVQTQEDAALCVEKGADGIIVSNHGGRAAETLRGTIDCLPEVIEGAGGRIPVVVDSGFRRGTDIYKALAMGAKAVCIGRPYIRGIGAFVKRNYSQQHY